MQDGPRLISIVGKKNCGKTTLMVALAAEFSRQGKRVGTLKHGTHPAKADQPGTDTWRHFHEGKAERTLIESGDQRTLFHRLAEEADPATLARTYMAEMDIVLAEGFTRHAVPKIEVFRGVAHDAPHYRADHPRATDWIALITDDTVVEVPFASFRFSDTAWLVTISALAWERALRLTP